VYLYSTGTVNFLSFYVQRSTACNFNSTIQAWLDKRRAELNGFLLIGAPLGGGLFSFIFPWMVDYFSWKGATLISIGVAAHLFILCPIYKVNPCSGISG